MTIYSPTSSITAQLTTKGRELLSQKAMAFVNFDLLGFTLGRGGYDKSDLANGSFLNFTTIEPEDEELEDHVFPAVYKMEVTTTSNFTRNETIGSTTHSTPVNWVGKVLSFDISDPTHKYLTIQLNELIIPVKETNPLYTPYSTNFSIAQAFTASGGGSGVIVNVTHETEPFSAIEQPNQFNLTFLCKCLSDSSKYGVGELGIWVRVTQNGLYKIKTLHNAAYVAGNILTANSPATWIATLHAVEPDANPLYDILTIGLSDITKTVAQGDTFNFSGGSNIAVVDAPILINTIGEKYLFAISHFPLTCKTDRTVLVKRVMLQF